jgi:hypothetical protein
MFKAEEYFVQFRLGKYLRVTVCDNKHDVVKLKVCFHWRGTPIDILPSRLKSYLEDAIKLKHLDPTPDNKQRQMSNNKVNYETVESWLTLARWLMVNPIPVKCVPGLYVCLCSYYTQLFFPDPDSDSMIQGGDVDSNRKLINHWILARRLYDMQVKQDPPTKITLQTDPVAVGTAGYHTILMKKNPAYMIPENGYCRSHCSLSKLITFIFTEQIHKKHATWVMKNRDNLTSVYTSCGSTVTASQILNNAPFAECGRVRDYKVYAMATYHALISH